MHTQVRDGVEREEQLRYARISGATIVKNFLESFRQKRLQVTFLKWSQDVARERRYEELAERVEYAVIIQRRVRGWRCKRSYDLFKRMQRAEYRNRAAAKVQARVRGILTRTRTREVFRDIIERKAAIKLQSLARRRRGHRHLLALRNARKRNLAALRIQSGARFFFAKREVRR